MRLLHADRGLGHFYGISLCKRFHFSIALMYNGTCCLQLNYECNFQHFNQNNIVYDVN